MSGSESQRHKLLAVISRGKSKALIVDFFCVCVRSELEKQKDRETAAKKREKDRTWETHSCRTWNAWRCYPWKASSSLLPWQRSLLGSSVAMARVSSMMQTRPHPPTPQQQCEAGRLYYTVCVGVRLFFFTPFFLSLLIVFPFPASSTDLWPLWFSGGGLLSWGWNEHGMCGDGSHTDVCQPQLLPAFRPLLIGCGAGHSVAVCWMEADSGEGKRTWLHTSYIYAAWGHQNEEDHTECMNSLGVHVACWCLFRSSSSPGAGSTNTDGWGHACSSRYAAPLVFLQGAVRGHVSDGLRWRESSIFPRGWFYCFNLECQEAVNLCTPSWFTPGAYTAIFPPRHLSITYLSSCRAHIFPFFYLHSVYVITFSPWWGNVCSTWPL